MAHDSSGVGTPTGREYVKYGAVVGTGLLAGCSADTDADRTTGAGKSTPETTRGTDAETASDAGEI
ncbi:hypothetical protein [Halogeometricum luteum]|uniref:Uncharacterized protein n=1 Tax=Halogeometricum luteum TaxID=2950537 RepID=A0ABU2FZS7_9EURY|nr:hypothetical protein [Halogeometricum sp. S3BR5-2]MDS0293736.1 hypothetical protein [Halogeometricum sp. S3BR5-2]